MIEPVNNISASQIMSPGMVQSAQKPEQVQQEFLVLFYKELLKNSMKTPNLSITDEKDSKPFGSLTSDVMLDKLAEEIARKQIAQHNLIKNR
jgi:ribosomal protein L9